MSHKPLAAVAHASLSKQHRRDPLLFAIFVESGLLRAELRENTSHPTVRWKLDDLHEALILQLLREKRERLKAQSHIAWRDRDLISLGELELEKLIVKKALADTGNVMPTKKSEVSA